MFSTGLSDLNPQQPRALKSQITDLIERNGLHNARSVVIYRHFSAEDFYYDAFRRQLAKKTQR